MKTSAPKNRPVHLYRGAPIVRAWSKHQQTNTRWTLCGIRIPLRNTGDKLPSVASESLAAVTCRYCLELASQGRSHTIGAHDTKQAEGVAA
jgi:hypothetical protein